MSDAFTYEFASSRPADETIRSLLTGCSADFEFFGYKLESHQPESAVFARRFTPPPVYQVPLAIAALAIVVGVAQTNATATAGGRIAGICVIAAVVLSLVVKSTERITFSARSESGVSQVFVTGQATRQLADYVRAFGENEVPADAAQPSRASSELTPAPRLTVGGAAVRALTRPFRKHR